MIFEGEYEMMSTSVKLTDDREHRISEYILSVKTFLSVIPDTMWPGITFGFEECPDTPYGGIRINLPSCSRLLHIDQNVTVTIKICYDHGNINFDMELHHPFIEHNSEQILCNLSILDMISDELLGVYGQPDARRWWQTAEDNNLTCRYVYHTDYHDFPITTFLDVVDNLYRKALYTDRTILAFHTTVDDNFLKAFPDIEEDCRKIIKRQVRYPVK